MEIEADNTISSLEKIPKKAAAKKTTNELSANLYGVEGKNSIDIMIINLSF